MAAHTQTMAALAEADEELLWRRLHDDDPAAREALVEHYLPFAKILAAKVYSERRRDEFEFGEYMQYATVGLLEAVGRFDPARGVKFKTFAGRRIIGSVLNGLEHLSERQQQISFRRRLASDRLDSIKNGEAAPSEPDRLFGYLAQVAVGLALGYILEDSGMVEKQNGSYLNSGYDAVEIEQLQQRVRGLVDTLPEREQKVIRYHYLQQFQFEEIAGILGVTKGRVSQIHKRAMELLRDAAKSVRSCDVAW